MEDLLSQAAAELEDLRHWNKSQQQQQQHATPEKQSRDTSPKHKRFPTACIHLLRSIPGNLRCVDCDATNPQWASISYGILLCIECSGKHRQMGVQTSVVRSISMDHWSHTEVLSMLEGGNKQLNDFFARHGLQANHQEIVNDIPALPEGHLAAKNRYKTNAAMFYRNNLRSHVKQVEESGIYKGREHSRQPRRRKSKKSITSTSTSSSTSSSMESEVGPQQKEMDTCSRNANTDAYPPVTTTTTTTTTVSS
jgi:hypothetical protein